MNRESSHADRRLWLDVLTIAAFCAFLFFFGLGAIGLTGADEPRYAQVAREMLARHDWITPVLYGKPWLEKPILYYWEAMLAYKIFGVIDWAARLPSAFSASVMVFAVFFVLRRIRPAAAMDAAIMTAATAACIGFSRAASTDMPLAAMFTIAMLGWFAAAVEGLSKPLAGSRALPVIATDQPEGAGHSSALRWSAATRAWLLGFYFFLALATLAKGPIAPALAGLVILIYAALTRTWKVIAATLWWPGILVFLAIAMPWYIAVQHANPQFAREFFLEQNLARFGTNLYRHKQPFWYYVPVLAAALAPWVVCAIAAFVSLFRINVLKSSDHKGTQRNTKETGLQMFLFVWAVVPVIFFSVSQSKLPGYILPAIPAWTLLLALFVVDSRGARRSSWSLIILHSCIASALVPAAFLLPAILFHHRPAISNIVVAIAAGVVLLIAVAFTLRRRGLEMLRFATVIPVILALAFVVRYDAPALDAKLSTRPLAAQITGMTPKGAPVAVFHASREVEYGIAFYLNQPVANYDRGEMPAGDHLVVARAGSSDALKGILGGRRLSKIGDYAAQDLELFWVSKPKLLSTLPKDQGTKSQHL